MNKIMHKNIPIDILEDLLYKSINQMDEEQHFIKFFFDNNEKVENESQIKEANRMMNINKELDSKFEQLKIDQNLEDSILKTIKAISHKYRLKFNNFYDLIRNDNIPKFVMQFFQISSIDNVCLKSKKSTKASQENSLPTKNEMNNIQAVINWLKIKEIKFQLLLFDFTTVKKAITSSILFFENFLNFFFLKTSKRQMIDRLKTILLTKNEQFDTYFQPIIFYGLLQFLIQKNLHFDYNKIDHLLEFYFKEANIPMIINEQIFNQTEKEFNFKLENIFFYQLQLIFDAIDSGPKSLYIREIFLSTMKVLNNIKVPKFDLIVSSIKAKQNCTSALNKDEATAKIDISSRIKQYAIKRSIFPKTFKERNENISNQNKPNKIENKIEKVEIKSFFNEKFESSLKCNEGIIINKPQSKINQKQSKKEWNDIVSSIQEKLQSETHVAKEKEENLKLQNFLSFSSSENGLEQKLYKMFVYNEIEKKWIYNQSSFKQFSKDKKIDIKESKVPLIFFIDSNENDSILISTKLMNSKYPNLDEDQIFIYAICDKSLSNLSFLIDFSDKIKSSIKPIFLLLHLPKSKQKLPNISAIVSQISLFLSLICDLKIVVLNKESLIDQIEFIKCIQNKNFVFPEKLEKIGDESIFSSGSSDKNENEEEQDYDDDDDENWGSVNQDEDVFIIQGPESKISESYSKIILKNSKTIFLFNDETTQYYNDSIEKLINETNFLKDVKSQFKNDVYINYINIKEDYTYKFFLTSLNEAVKTHCSTFNEVENNFECINLSEINDFYFEVKLNYSNWREILKNIIQDRFSFLKSKKLNDLQLFFELNKEMNSISPVFDYSFMNECSSIISELKKETNIKIRDFLSSELKISANLHLDYIKDEIKRYRYLSNFEMNAIASSHNEFLKEDFLSIIQMTSEENKIDFAYENNSDLIELQIREDDAKIKEIFKEFIEKVKIKQQEKIKDAKELLENRTNYAMRETENLKEVKITVELNKDLKSEIEQDF